MYRVTVTDDNETPRYLTGSGELTEDRSKAAEFTREQADNLATQWDEGLVENNEHTHPEGEFCCPCGECCLAPVRTEEQQQEDLKAFNKLLVSRGYEPR